MIPKTIELVDCNRTAIELIGAESSNNCWAPDSNKSIKKNGLLEIIETKESLASIGVQDMLKDWLLKRRNAFGKEAGAYRAFSPAGAR